LPREAGLCRDWLAHKKMAHLPLPGDQFYVRWHRTLIPTDIDILIPTVSGHVNQTFSMSLNDILHGSASFELPAVNQCSGNSRDFLHPSVPGGEWANGTMVSALRTDIPLNDVLDKAGVKRVEVQVCRKPGLDWMRSTTTASLALSWHCRSRLGQRRSKVTSNYKAPIVSKDVGMIAEYLTTHKGAR